MRVAMAASLSSSPYTCSSKSIVLSKCSPKIKLGTNRFTISASTSVLSGGSPLLQAAKHTVDAYVKSGMVVGLGSGQASGMAIQYLGRLLRAGALKDIVGVPMSIASASEAAKAGIPLDQFNDSSQIQHIGIRATNLGKPKKMAKKYEERFESLEQEVSEMKVDLQKLPVMEEKLSTIMKNIERLNVQNEKQQQHQ
ncbi:putative ribose-5-phosphate isomerase 4 [Cucumis melo var. makuwa]|uniref:Ribose-5-phosphate isomerase 4 n=1 Tax=Cucumis melo var. makuwa TaxID=1194695 RepID=A0A5D3BSE7_CUCMM|nr:putative ribose-5-phosphate isomerase 4 [Cucumis melo var. makuwa]TYK02671.1 putative ribose-5-phosphate isomerase 4 [Cucumis melo var. makuwa]